MRAWTIISARTRRFLPNDGYGCGYGEAQDPVGVKSFPHEFDDLDYVSCTTNHA